MFGESETLLNSSQSVTAPRSSSAYASVKAFAASVCTANKNMLMVDELKKLYSMHANRIKAALRIPIGLGGPIHCMFY